MRSGVLSTWRSRAVRATDVLSAKIERVLGQVHGVEALPVERPIFIVGMERSGTTLLYSLLANHPSLYWLSRVDDVMPRAPRLAAWVRQGWPEDASSYRALQGTTGRSAGGIPPSEGVPYWRHIFQWGSEAAYRVGGDQFGAEDLDVCTQKWVRTDVGKRLYLSGKPRALFKQPGFALKLPCLDVLFPDALFLCCIRNPWDNLRSMVRVKETVSDRFWGTKPPDWQHWIDATPALQAAYQLDYVTHMLWEQSRDLAAQGRYLEVRYEDVVRDTWAVLERVVNFCALPLDAPTEEDVRSAAAFVQQRPRRPKQRAAYPEEVLEHLDRVCERLGYAGG